MTPLSPRQHQCLYWRVRGKSDWVISKIIGISHHTVRFHLREAFRRMGGETSEWAIYHAGKMGLFDGEEHDGHRW